MPPLNLRQRVRQEPGLLKRSAKMMSAQSKIKSKLFRSWPPFVQQTLWHGGATGFEASWRSLPVEERLEIAERLKGEGKELYRAGSHEDAAERYAQAAGLFHYVQRTGQTPDLGSIDDAYLRLETVEGDAAVDALRATCYSNIAQCLLRQAKPDCGVAQRACDAALALDPANTKALYRRALAREGLGERAELEAALGDLTRADTLSPGDASVQAAKRRIAAELRRQKEAGRRMFGGFLGRASLGGAHEHERTAAAAGEADAAGRASGADLRKQLEDASRLREASLAQGREDDVRDAERAIAVCQARLRERENRDVDIFQPSEDLKREARKFGIDLDDPEERRRVDRAMWDVHRVTDLEESEDEKEPPQRHAKGKRLASRFCEAAVVLVAFTALLWSFLILRGRAPGS